MHRGASDSSVLYIPICPVTEINAKYLVRQREAFINGTPGPDFPGGVGESHHINRRTPDYLHKQSGIDGLRAAGFEKLVTCDGHTVGARKVIEKANTLLGI
jgi:hypothetical protein